MKFGGEVSNTVMKEVEWYRNGEIVPFPCGMDEMAGGLPSFVCMQALELTGNGCHLPTSTVYICVYVCMCVCVCTCIILSVARFL